MWEYSIDYIKRTNESGNKGGEAEIKGRETEDKGKSCNNKDLCTPAINGCMPLPLHVLSIPTLWF